MRNRRSTQSITQSLTESIAVTGSSTAYTQVPTEASARAANCGSGSSGSGGASDIEQTLLSALEEPQQVSGDTGSLTNRSVSEIIRADEYIRARRRQTCGNRRRLLQSLFTPITPPGARDR